MKKTFYYFKSREKLSYTQWVRITPDIRSYKVSFLNMGNGNHGGKLFSFNDDLHTILLHFILALTAN